MEITIEMIEQVLDATGADYHTVKAALQEHAGNVEEAISAIKEKILQPAAADEAVREGSAEEESDQIRGTEEELKEADESDQGQEDSADQEPDSGDGEDRDPAGEFFSDEYAYKVVDRIKERVKAGNVDMIRISREDKILLEVPVNVGVIGGLLGLLTVPWAMIIGVITAYGFNCKIQIIKSDGSIEDLFR